MKRFKFHSDFKLAIKEELEEIMPSFKLIHLKVAKFQIILDGFDELHLISDGRMDDFLMSLNEFHKDYPEVNITLTGRTIAFKHYLNYIPIGSVIVEIQHFTEPMIVDWVEKWVKLKGYQKPLSQEIIKLNTNNLSHHDVDTDEDEYEDEEDNSLNNYDDEEQLVSLPLFLYLICTMLYEDDKADVEDLIRLKKWQFYQRLMDWTCATTKFDDDFNPFHSRMSLKDLSIYKRTFNKNISLSMYHANKFYITYKDIMKRDLLPEDLDTDGSEVRKLVNSFIVLNYMKESYENNTETEQAFEFVHKSFYEYLVAEALMDSLILITINETNLERLAEYIYKAFSGFRLSDEILFSYLVPMLEAQNYELLVTIFEKLEVLYENYVLNHKFLNDNNINFLENYYKHYPENTSNKILLETNVLFSLLKLMPLLAELSGKKFKINPIDFANQFRKIIQFSSDIFNASELHLNFVDLSDSVIVNVNLSEIDLSQSTLKNSRIKFTDLSFASFNRSDLVNMQIYYSDLEGTDFDNSNLKATRIYESNLADTSIIEADLSEIKINKCNFTNVALDRSLLDNSEIIQCDFSGTVFNESSIRNSLFSYVDLTEAFLQECQLVGSNLSNSKLNYTSLTNSNLQTAKLSFCDLSYADLRGADLSNSDLSNADLSYADLTGALLENANLHGANLSHAKIIGVNFKNSNLSECIFSNTVIQETDLSYSIMDYTDLTTSEFIDYQIHNTSMRYVILDGQDFSLAPFLQGIDFSFGKISNSNFSGSDFNGSKLNNVTVVSCLFENVDFYDSEFINSSFENCKMALSTFENSKIINSKFRTCDLFETDFNKSTMRNAKFKGSNLLFSNIYNRTKDDDFVNVILPSISKRILY